MIYDHKGNEYSTFTEMCDGWMVGVDDVVLDLINGVSLKDALEKNIEALEKEFFGAC